MTEQSRSGRRLNAATRRKVAVRACCDPRTVDAVVRGEPIDTMARERAYRVLRRMRLIEAREISR